MLTLSQTCAHSNFLGFQLLEFVDIASERKKDNIKYMIFGTQE
jgi:hypothetical protein